MDGVIFLNKEVDITSRDACDKVSRILKTKKVGHAGTLDPFATGLLMVLVNKATRCSMFFDDLSKGYIATITLGEERDSSDPEGKVINTQEVPSFSKFEIEKVLNSFLGKQLQTPPMTSAIHVNGRKLYELARKGIEIDRPAREIEIYKIKLLDYSDNKITFYTHVSKGTYIRVLGSDIAKKLGTIGYLTTLIRSEVGPFKLEDALDINEVNENKIIPTFEVLNRFCEVKKVDTKLATDIKNGKIKKMTCHSDKHYLLITEGNNDLVAMYIKIENNQYEFRKGLFA